jgi:NlpC/P60 family
MGVTVRHCRNGAILLLLICMCGGALSSAQQVKAAKIPATKFASAPQVPLLAADDGLTILAAALDERNRQSDKADCSHLVHDVYERAGFTYKYEPSSDIYAGLAEFRRVTHPQPGDLIVWPGHVGIVISPAQHTFYSSLTSGFGVEYYDSSYWKHRGHPRFFRFIKDPKAVQPPKAAALKTASLETKSPITTEEADDVENSPATIPQEPKPSGFPHIMTIESSKPSAQQVSETVLDALSQAAEGLRRKNVFGLPQTVVVLSRFEVKKVKIKNNTGWADLQITESASLTGGKSNLKKRQQKHRWTLRRRDVRVWELVVPEESMYLNQDDAVRLLSQQLAAMTAEDSTSDPRQKAQIAALLGALLQVKN